MPSQPCDLKAVEPLVKIVGLLDRYHGLAAASAMNRRAVEPHAFPAPSRGSRTSQRAGELRAAAEIFILYI